MEKGGLANWLNIGLTHNFAWNVCTKSGPMWYQLLRWCNIYFVRFILDLTWLWISVHYIVVIFIFHIGTHSNVPWNRNLISESTQNQFNICPIYIKPHTKFESSPSIGVPRWLGPNSKWQTDVQGDSNIWPTCCVGV